MSDTKLRPEDLTATVREMYPPPPPLAGWLGFYYDSGFYDSEQGKREDAGWYCSGKVHADREEALCELAGFRPFEGSALVEVGQASALFGEPASEAKGELTTADRIAADLAAGTFRGVQPESAFPVGNCPTCGELVAPWNKHAKYEGGYTCQRPQPAPPEPAAREMLEAVRVGTFQLEELLKYADLAEVSLRTGFSPPDFLGVDLPYLLRSSIAVVRQQAAQGRKVELGKVRELIFMVRNLTPYLAQLGYADLSRSFNDYADAALAEIDAAEGKRTAGEHMSELSGEPLPHYLRDARLTANGMRAAAEIARNFRPKSACTCGGYISFHYGIPCHQPGCPVGECLEIADEINARADEIDETPDRWLAELDAAEGRGEGRS